MIIKEDICKLVEKLREREVRLYHACQLQDFISYLKLGGVPSRERLEQKGKSFTSFLSDSTDKSNEVWDKVFFNFDDFGRYFHKHKVLTTPNVYGPIVLVFEPDILANASDVSVTLRSAGANGFSRSSESLNFDDIDKIFSYPSNDKYRKSWTKTIEELSSTFKEEKNIIVKSNPEINCTFSNNIFAIGQESLDNLVEIRVDPLTYNSKKLLDLVKHSATDYNPLLGDFVKQRFSDNFYIYNLIVSFAGLYSGTELRLKNESEQTPIKKWVYDFAEKSHFYQFHRYLRYLKEGTLTPMNLSEEDFKKLLAA